MIERRGGMREAGHRENSGFPGIRSMGVASQTDQSHSSHKVIKSLSYKF